MTQTHHERYADHLLRGLIHLGGPLDESWLSAFEAALRDQQVDLDAVLTRLVDKVTEQMGADRCTLYLTDHARGEVVSRVAILPEIQEIRLRLGEGIAGTVASEGQPLRVSGPDDRIAPRVDEQTGYQTHALLAVPVTHQGNNIGVLQVLNKPGGFDGNDEQVLGRVASRLAPILVSSSLGSQLRPGLRQPLSFRFNHIVGESAAMQAVYDRTDRAAQTDATVLVRGESGVGKELIARAVHCNSPRSNGPFVKVDCAALPGTLIENELFGHEKGAYTGAGHAADGKVLMAVGGTLFLDEIGELDLSVQGKLLRLLQERTYLRVGGTQPFHANVRFVCATNRDLETEVAGGRFRRDLYYRIRVVEIGLPPVRQRGGGDLDRLIDHFLYLYCQEHGRPELRFTDEARRLLHGHPWPGNVRELQHCIESAVVLAPELEIGPAHLNLAPAPEAAWEKEHFRSGLQPLREVEEEYIRWALEQCEGNRTHAADALGIGRNTLNRKLKES